MRHIDIRDLWLQKEVAEGRTEVSKIPGEKSPADLMTKILTMGEIAERLGSMHIHAINTPTMHIAVISSSVCAFPSQGDNSIACVGALGGIGAMPSSSGQTTYDR